MDQRVIVITGPTASGKSALALALAERHRGTVINADAMQTYDAFPILTAQPTPAERSARAACALRRPAAQRGPVGGALAGARRRRDRALPGRGPHAHPVRRLGPLLADADAGHCDHPRYAGRPARPGQCASGTSLGAEAFRARLAEKDPAIVGAAEARRPPTPCPRLGGRGSPPAGRSAPGRQARASRRAGASRRCCWRRSAAGCGTASRSASMRCWRAACWPRCAPCSIARPIRAGPA